VILHADGTLHFSDLKQFAQSPAHYRHAIAHPKEKTRAMLVGTYVDRVLTGGKVPPIYNGKRQGEAWAIFRQKVREEGGDVDEIVTATEADEGDEMARAIATNTLAMDFLTGTPQVPLRWSMMGIPCSTRGLDVVGKGWFSDLKTSMTAEPERLFRHARSLHWDAQLAFYREACKQNDISVAKGIYLVVVESKAPYLPTVVRMSEEALQDGDRKVHQWLEELRRCTDSDHWPGYVQDVVTMPGLMEAPTLTGFDDEEADDGVE
jgi:hypothetical protein